jgi:hypothetical protein
LVRQQPAPEPEGRAGSRRRRTGNKRGRAGISTGVMASQTTRDHDAIQRWARTHGATPAVVSRTERSASGHPSAMLRFEFSSASQSALEAVDWGDFFRIFDERGLELIYDDKPGSRFHKFAYPETIAAPASKPAKPKPAARSPRRRAA